MSTKFKTVITTAGAVKLAAATLPGGKKVNITAMAVGDGGGILPVPDAGQTRLVNEVWRHALNKISQDNRHSNYVVAELVIPPEVGGFWMRELGLYDDEGTLIAVSNMAESYKPELAEGSGRAQTCRMVIIVSSVASVALSVDSTMVMATQDYVDEAISAHEKSRRHPDATTQEKGFTQLSNATDSEAETLAATPKAVKSAYDLALSKYTAQDASILQKGLVQLSNATDSEADSLATTPKAVKIAMDNASARLAKERNGADIPNKPLFVQNIGLQDTVNKAANAVQRTGDTMAWLNVTGLVQSASMRVNIPASPSVQGLTIDWNGVGSGTAGLTNNRGLGAGGFIFRTVDAENKTEYGRVTFNEDGEIFAGKNIYAGSAKYAIDGNSYGTIWGVAGGSDWLSNYLATKFSGIQNQFTAIPVNNTTGDISGTAWGGSLAVNLTVRFNDLQSKINAIPVDNTTGNIRGSAWGNDWLSNHLANKWAGIQNQFNAIPVDNPTGNIHGSAWGNDWLSNWLASQFSARDNNINIRAPFDWVTANYLPRGQNYATVGTFMMAYYNGGNVDPETVVSGGNLFPSTADGLPASWSLPGSWRCAGMSRTVNDAHRTTLWQRVA